MTPRPEESIDAPEWVANADEAMTIAIQRMGLTDADNAAAWLVACLRKMGWRLMRDSPIQM